MKVFITGITGFVGSKLANKFIKEGFEVSGLGRKNKLPSHIDPRCIYIKEDITKSVSEITAEIVIHAAAQVDDNACYSNHYENNVIGTANVINACTNKKTLFILISTSSVYPFTKESPYLEEDAGLEYETLSAYGKTKYLAEQLLVKNKNLSSKIILRPRAIYGPDDTVLLPRLLSLVKKGLIILPQHITTQISLTHINNLMYAVERSFYLQKNNILIFNVADNQIYSLKEVIPLLINSVITKKRKVFFVQKQIWILLVKLNNIFRFIPQLTTFGSKQLTQVALLDTSRIKNYLPYNFKYNVYNTFT